MKPCIYGAQTHPEGATICVNGRELRCVKGEWAETGHACAAAPVQPGVSDANEAPAVPGHDKTLIGNGPSS